jgi:autotransporter strand-loop-strand O-heptosyltransferase
MNILFLAPHLSTGGMPQFLLKRIENLIDTYNKIFVVEYECLSDQYVVQRNQIINLIGKENLFTLDDNKFKLIDIIKEKSVQIVHIDHEAEGFDLNLMEKLYANNRNYRIIETCHNVSFNPKNKIFIPDAFAFCTPYHIETFKDIQTEKKVIMYPLEIIPFNEIKHKNALDKLKFDTKKTNVLSVGLWCDNKNQAKVLEIAEQYTDYDFHIVGNQAENFADYWKPLMKKIPKNVKVWGEREDIEDFMILSDIFLFPSKKECNPIVLREAISHELTIYANNLPQYCGMYDGIINALDSPKIKYKARVNSTNDTFHFKNDHEDLYKSILKSKIMKQPKEGKVSINHHFVDGAFIEINGKSTSTFKVEFFDENGLFYEDTIQSNSWVKLNRKYYTEYHIKVTEIKADKQKTSEVIFDQMFDLKGKRVMISFESSSLGDTLAWLPYCDEFQKKHDCVLFVSTFKNFLFKDQYPNIFFIEPAEVINNLQAKYDLGWFYDSNKEPVLPNTIPLQQTATNILGLSFSELKPKLNFTPKMEWSNTQKPYVCIAPDSTAGCKEWDLWNWQKLVYYLIDNGFEVVNVSINTKYNLEKVLEPKDLSLETTMQIIHFSEYFIGLSSGLSWLAWALNKHVYMIANFTTADHEFQSDSTRITNTSVCHGCWNNKNFKFDKGNWNWCPIWDGYDKQFECQKGISVHDMVIKIGINKKNRVHI